MRPTSADRDRTVECAVCGSTNRTLAAWLLVAIHCECVLGRERQRRGINCFRAFYIDD